MGDSDRGSQSCSELYQLLLAKHGLIRRMRGAGNCYDDTCSASFDHSLKVGVIHGARFETRDKMRSVVFEYSEVDYNRIRRHITNGQISPVAIEAKQVA